MDTTILAALVSALISAVVSFLVVWYKTYVLDPKQRQRAEETLRKQLIVTWIAYMKSNEQILLKRERHLEQLTVDERPLDRLALTDAQLVETMTEVRSRILALNREIQLYDVVLGPQLKYLLMPNMLRESVPVDQLQSGESDSALRVQRWRDNYLTTLDSKRIPLLSSIEQLLKSLEKALEREKD